MTAWFPVFAAVRVVEVAGVTWDIPSTSSSSSWVVTALVLEEAKRQEYGQRWKEGQWETGTHGTTSRMGGVAKQGPE